MKRTLSVGLSASSVAMISLFVFVQPPKPAWACLTHALDKSIDLKRWKKAWARSPSSPGKAQRKISSLTAGGLPSGKNQAWGGDDPAKWRPEAVLANAASEELNAAWGVPAHDEIADVLVSAPVRFVYQGADRPYGDGQTNASLGLGAGWSEKAPPFLAVMIRFASGSRTIRLKFHASLSLPKKEVQVVYFSASGQKRQKALSPVNQAADGSFVVEWTPDSDGAPAFGDVFQSRVAYIQPTGWKDWFPVDFRDTVMPAAAVRSEVPDSVIASANAKVPAGRRTLTREELTDPEHIAATTSSPGIPSGKLTATTGSDIGGQNFGVITGVHNPYMGTPTAVGEGFTWGFLNPPVPLKTLYTCFSARNREGYDDASGAFVPGESQLGVPSGGGWHEIGDAAETIFNTLEAGSVLVGFGSGQPGDVKPPSGDYAYGLSDVAVLRKLAPGQALITSAGPTTLHEDPPPHPQPAPPYYGPDRDKGAASGRNYHWFAFSSSEKTCTVEWVHPCVPRPDNHLGTACGP